MLFSETNLQLDRMTLDHVLVVIGPVIVFVLCLLAVGLVFRKHIQLRVRKLLFRKKTEELTDKVILDDPDPKLCEWRDECTGYTGSGSG